MHSIHDTFSGTHPNHMPEVFMDFYIGEQPLLNPMAVDDEERDDSVQHHAIVADPIPEGPAVNIPDGVLSELPYPGS